MNTHAYTFTNSYYPSVFRTILAPAGKHGKSKGEYVIFKMFTWCMDPQTFLSVRCYWFFRSIVFQSLRANSREYVQKWSRNKAYAYGQGTLEICKKTMLSCVPSPARTRLVLSYFTPNARSRRPKRTLRGRERERGEKERRKREEGRRRMTQRRKSEKEQVKESLSESENSVCERYVIHLLYHIICMYTCWTRCTCQFTRARTRTGGQTQSFMDVLPCCENVSPAQPIHLDSAVEATSGPYFPSPHSRHTDPFSSLVPYFPASQFLPVCMCVCVCVCACVGVSASVNAIVSASASVWVGLCVSECVWVRMYLHTFFQRSFARFRSILASSTRDTTGLQGRGGRGSRSRERKREKERVRMSEVWRLMQGIYGINDGLQSDKISKSFLHDNYFFVLWIIQPNAAGVAKNLEI